MMSASSKFPAVMATWYLKVDKSSVNSNVLHFDYLRILYRLTQIQVAQNVFGWLCLGGVRVRVCVRIWVLVRVTVRVRNGLG